MVKHKSSDRQKNPSRFKNDMPERVTLITPPSPFLLDERVFMSLGILKIAAMLETRGIEVDFLDLAGVENYLEAVTAYIKNNPTEVIGLTTTTPQLPNVVEIVKTIRSIDPGIKIILGGPHITLTHSAVKLEMKASRLGRAHKAYQQLANLADVLVSGDGEIAIFTALKTDSPKLVDGDDPTSGLFMTDDFYEKTPFPARHLAKIESYHYDIEGHRATSLIAQLGCPFGCGFCGGRNSKSLRMIRTRSSESIVSEIEHLHKEHGFTGFMFYDDELNVNKNMIDLMNKITDLQSKLGVEFRLRGFVKSQLFTEEQAKAMYGAGFRWLLSGFESGSPRILENINKKATVEENSRCIDFARNAGLKVKALMSVGHPGESKETIEQTQQWLLKAAPDDFDCTVITTYPGTPYYDEALPHESAKGIWTYTYKKNGDRLHSVDVDFLKVAEYYKGDPNGGYKAFVFTDHLTSQELVEARNWIETSVREKLNIPYPKARAAIQFEHSMGQNNFELLNKMILGKSQVKSKKKAA